MVESKTRTDDAPFDLTAYLNRGMEDLVRSFLRVSGLRSSLAFRKAEKVRKRLAARGEWIPPFLIASITTRCNLFCTGCYARANQARAVEPRTGLLSTDQWSRLFQEAKDCGIPFILLAGGEPFLRMDVLEKAAAVKQIVFPVFTNGTLLGERALQLLETNKNLVPVLSLEGGRSETDGRRSEGTYDTLLGVMDRLKSRGGFFGVSITVTAGNLTTVTSREFHRRLEERGCKAVLFVEYVPLTPATESLALSDTERTILEQEQNLLRSWFPHLLFLSFPGDEKQAGGCLAAGRGFFHIAADGSAEPCPFSPYSDTNLCDRPLRDALASPLFRHLASGILTEGHTGGCLLARKERQVRDFLGL
jgi:MoaA/NifB/PqqE/SkfB family radical SAM enzyme